MKSIVAEIIEIIAKPKDTPEIMKINLCSGLIRFLNCLKNKKMDWVTIKKRNTNCHASPPHTKKCPKWEYTSKLFLANCSRNGIKNPDINPIRKNLCLFSKS